MQGDESDATRHTGPDAAPDPVAPTRAPLPRQRPATEAEPVAAPAAPPVIPVPVPQAPPRVADPIAVHEPIPTAPLPARSLTSPEPVAPWPPVGPFPPRIGNTGQHPVIQPRTSAENQPMPGEPAVTGFVPPDSPPSLPPRPQPSTGQFPVVPHQTGTFPGRTPTGQFPPVPPRTGQFPTGQFPAGQFPAGQFPGSGPTGQFPTGQFPGSGPTGQFPSGPHLGVPSQSGPQMYAPPQQPYPGPPYPPQHHPGQFGYPQFPPPVPPRRSRITGLRAALLVALALILVTPPAAIAFEAVRRERTASGSAQGVDPAGRNPGQANGKPGPSGSPKASTPPSVDAKVKQALADQGAALLKGDADGFVAAVDPSAATLREDLTRRFNSLRQLQVKVWEPSVLDAVKVGTDNTADVIVYVKYCYVVTTCDPMNLETKTKWSVTGGTVKLLEFGVAEDLGPRPWERSELRVAVGKRVVMATTPKYASRLTTMLTAAEKAAELADRYSKWSPAPSRYVVYLAGPEEWSTWYGIKQESWVAGFALPLTADATEIVLNANRVDVKETLDVLRHEFTHVVTLAKVSRAYDQTWWLVEGIAEYVRVQGLGGRFDDVTSVRKYVQSGRWANEIAMDDPPEGTSSADVSGRYGVAYLAVNRMAERFGEAKMLEFFDLTARQGEALQEAATKVYGVSWDDVATDCVKYVRNHV
ncbi:hypothetical protein GCM10010532_094730 [Dactylosporangium siamense]|uniref:Peptidase MA-like domain-containing protein n=2 Tax=Dactylosporangium siamense TaxID=685454 RepID=A0A919PXH4_9ACTN|nr:hypothetical protein Dsi01nite_084790 [Dactylosporangium siamense]